MADNEHVSKVELSDGTVLVDLTEDTVEAGNLLRGKTAHSASGAPVTGTMGDFLPIEAGVIYPYAGSTAPTGYLMCDGAAYSRTEYSELFAAIGTTYGAGDGSTTFNVPDLRGRTLVGSNASHALGTTGGSETVTLTTAQMPSHTHTVGAHKHTVPKHGHGFTQPTVNGGATTTGGGGSHNHRPAYNGNNSYVFMTYLVGGGVSRSRVVNGTDSYVFRTGTQSDLLWRDYTTTVDNHTHSQVAHTHSVSGGAVSDKAAFDTNDSSAFASGSSGSGNAHDNMQPYGTVNYIISTGSQYVGFKGEKGDKGNTGDAAGFGTPTATVDSNVGTPSVSVTASGPDTAKVFSFEFENLKGDKGDKGDPLTVEDFLPIEAGMIYPYGGSTAPTGYLMCDGSAYSRTDYPELFAVIGTTYGAGDGTTTFNVPDLRGKIPLGSSTSYALGSTGGSITHNHTTAGHALTPAETATKNHSHSYDRANDTGGSTAITIDQMPSHAHNLDFWGGWGSDNITRNGSMMAHEAYNWTANNISANRMGGGDFVRNTGGGKGHTHTQPKTSTSTGGQTEANGASHSHGNTGDSSSMQPYGTVNYVISTGSQYVGFKGQKGDKGDPGDATDLIHVSTTQPAGDSTAIIWFNPVDGAFKAKRNVSGTWVWKELAFVDDSNAA